MAKARSVRRHRVRRRKTSKKGSKKVRRRSRKGHKKSSKHRGRRMSKKDKMMMNAFGAFGQGAPHSLLSFQGPYM